MSEPEPMVLTRRDGDITYLTLNRRERRNALCIELLEDVKTFFLEEARKERPALAVILRSNGPAFCAGSDFKELNDDISTGATDHMSETSHMETTFQAVESYPYPVIARLKGGVYGAGCMLACACDIRVGVSGMKFSKNPAKLGLIYPPVGIDRLIRTVGPNFAKEMLLTGHVYDDDTALQTGFITHLRNPVEADSFVQDLAQEIVQLNPRALRAIKEMFRILGTDPVDHERLNALHNEVSTGDDAIEGVRAILEKRKPEWQ